LDPVLNSPVQFSPDSYKLWEDCTLPTFLKTKESPEEIFRFVIQLLLQIP